MMGHATARTANGAKKRSAPSPQDIFVKLRDRVFEDMELLQRVKKGRLNHPHKFVMRKDRIAKPSDRSRVFSVSGYVEGLADPAQTIRVTLIKKDGTLRVTKRRRGKGFRIEIEQDGKNGAALMIRGYDYGIPGASKMILGELIEDLI